jgi:acyl-CoA reductase-like NAD-dependent aldehyde dehydrogenase
MTLTAVNPADGSQLGRFEELSGDQVTAAIERAHSAFLEWRERPLAERCDLLRSLAATLRENKAELAREATLEMGKILREAEGEVEKSAVFCEYYADNAERLLAPEVSKTVARSRTTFATSRLAWCWPSCPGTSRTCRSSASLRRRWSRATSPC